VVVQAWVKRVLLKDFYFLFKAFADSDINLFEFLKEERA
jgi:hypothetical protein